MVDLLTPNQRSFNMSRIRGENTKPEMFLRRGLHARGFRLRLHRADLPGRPDTVFRFRKAVVHLHGCVWHGHDCPMYQLPATRRAFWRARIEANRVRDPTAMKGLTAAGWRMPVVRQRALRGPGRRSEGTVLSRCERLLASGTTSSELAGHWRAGVRTRGAPTAVQDCKAAILKIIWRSFLKIN